MKELLFLFVVSKVLYIFAETKLYEYETLHIQKNSVSSYRPTDSV